jgi:endonuclease YncB( thermonuclease family)
MNQQRDTNRQLSPLTWSRKWLRIVPRRRFRQLRAWFRRFNATKGREWREKAHASSEQAAAKISKELGELIADSSERYERWRPHIEQATQRTRERTEQAWRSAVRWVRITVPAVFLLAVIAAVITAAVVLTRDSETEDPNSSAITLRCESCLAMSVSRIIDGDTIDTNLGRIRIYGADTPEVGERCFSEATDEMRQLAGNQVRGERGPRLTDHFDRHLYYLYTDSGASIDELLVRNGFAFAWIRDGQHSDLLVDLEKSARLNRVGCLWN